jgi:HEAT repeat protein
MRTLVVEWLRLASDSKRSEFFGRLSQSRADNQPDLKVTADWLRFEFRNAVTNARPLPQADGKSWTTKPAQSQPPKVEPTSRKPAPERFAEKQNPQSQESSIFEWNKSEQPKSAAASDSNAAYQRNPRASATDTGSQAQNNYELTADFDQEDDEDSDVRLAADSNSSAADMKFFDSITQSSHDSHTEQSYSSEVEFASSGSQAFMSLSGMLATPEIPMHSHSQNARVPNPGQVPQNYRGADSQNFGQTPWSLPQNSTPAGAYDTSAMTGNTPAFSNPYFPMMPPGGMPSSGVYPPAMPASMMQPGMMQPGMMQPGMMQPGMMQPESMGSGSMSVIPAFDMTSSSPLIPAFTNVTTHPANSSGIVSSQASPAGGQQTTHALVVANIALPANDQPAVDEAALERVQATEAQERALARLRKTREEAFRTLLADSEDIPKAMPRLLQKRISTLMSTPSTKMDQTIEQVLALGTMHSPAALETLSAFCQKPAKQIREACAKAMGEIPHAGSAVLLMKLLGDKSGTVVEAALKSLTKLDLAPTRQVLFAAGLCGTNLRTVVIAGVESAAEQKKTEWETLLLEKLREDDTECAAFAVSLLSRFVGDTHLEIFQKVASHKAPVLRAAAIEALSRTQAKRAMPQLNSALEDTDATVRAQAALSVATMYSPRSIELLQKLVFDGNLNVRRNAAQTMSRIDEPDLGETIAKALDLETDATTVEYLLAALHRNGAESSLSILQRYIDGELSQFREQALKALRKLKIPASIPIFRRLLDDHVPAMRRQSVEQLVVLKFENILPRLREMMKQDPDETVRAACAKAIGDFGDEGSVHLLEDALEDHALVRQQAVISLGRLGQSSAGPILLSLMRDQMPGIRYHAVRAIAQLKLEGVAEQIAALLDDSDEMVRRGAEQSLKDLGQSTGKIRSKRMKTRLVKVASLLMPSSLAGMIPGGSKSLLSVIVVALVVGGYWGLSRASFYAGGGEQLPVGWIVSLDVSAQNKITAALREDAVLDIWSLEDSALVTRVSVPETTKFVLVEPKGGVLLLMENELGRLDPATDYDPEKLEKIELPGVPSAVSFHEASGSLCLFYNGGNTTSLKIMDPVTLQESRSFTIKAPFEGACTVSSDFSIAVTLDSKGNLKLADLSTGDVVSGLVSNIVGTGVDLGQVYAATLTGDMKHIVFCAKGGCVIIDAGNLRMVSKIESPDAYGFINAKPTDNGSDLVVLSATGVVYNVTNKFETVVQSRIERDESFDLASVSGGGELVAVANTEGYDFDVYSVIEKKTLMRSTQ